MNATLRLTGLGNNSATLLQLSSSKLIELLVEDDDTLKELADGGSIVGLSLDEIERTPTRILARQHNCQLLRKNIANSLQKLTEQSETIQAILSDFWANGESLDHATVESARDLLNLFSGSWHHLQNTNSRPPLPPRLLWRGWEPRRGAFVG